MDSILNIKREILNGKNIAENYKLLLNMINNKKKEIENIGTKINKDIVKKNKCADINIIQQKIDSLSSKDILNDSFIEDYRDILSNINYLYDYYTNNTTIIKKISLNGNKVTLHKL